MDHVHRRWLVATTRQQVVNRAQGDVSRERDILIDEVAGCTEQRGGIGK